MTAIHPSSTNIKHRGKTRIGKSRPTRKSGKKATQSQKLKPSSSSWVAPRPSDVACGRGCGRYNKQEGNRVFHKLIKACQVDYDTADREEKGAISKQIIDKLTQEGRRFLSMNPFTKMWEELSYKQQINKASQTFRDLRCKQSWTSDDDSVTAVDAVVEKPRPPRTRELPPRSTRWSGARPVTPPNTGENDSAATEDCAQETNCDTGSDTSLAEEEEKQDDSSNELPPASCKTTEQKPYQEMVGKRLPVHCTVVTSPLCRSNPDQGRVMEHPTTSPEHNDGEIHQRVVASQSSATTPMSSSKKKRKGTSPSYLLNEAAETLLEEFPATPLFESSWVQQFEPLFNLDEEQPSHLQLLSPIMVKGDYEPIHIGVIPDPDQMVPAPSQGIPETGNNGNLEESAGGVLRKYPSVVFAKHEEQYSRYKIRKIQGSISRLDDEDWIHDPEIEISNVPEL